MNNKELIEYAIECLNECADYSKTLFSENVSYIKSILEGKLRRTSKYLEKYYKKIEDDN